MNNGNLYFVSDKLYNNETVNTDDLESVPVIAITESKGRDIISDPKSLLYIDRTLNEITDEKLSSNFESIIRLMSSYESLEEFKLYILNQVLYLDQKLYHNIYDYYGKVDVDIYPKIVFKSRAMTLLF